MKNTITFFAILISTSTFSQYAQIHVVSDKLNLKRTLLINRPLQTVEVEGLKSEEKFNIDTSFFNISLVVDKPEIMYLTSYLNDSIEFSQPVFLKNGYELILDLSSKNEKSLIIVKGKGAEDNQLWGLKNDIDLNKYVKDTLPYRVQEDLKNESNKNHIAFQNYITNNNPSIDFINCWNVELKYSSIKAYYIFLKQRNIFIRNAFERNKKVWDGVYEELLVDAPLMNETAFNSFAYRLFVKMVLIFNKPAKFSNETEREEYIKEWYVENSDTDTRNYSFDENNIPNQKTIEKYFTGNVKEYLYAQLFDMALESGKTINIDSIYIDFAKQYPYSKYKKIFEKSIATVFESFKNPINEKVIFETDTLKTWDQVLKLFKGKTVLLDMWGTWCGPCRESIKKYSKSIKSTFENKNLEYLFIANNDQKNLNTWKSLIAYYNMEGHHILASQQLTDDIKKNIKLKAYPTYLIIHKDGSYKVSEALLESPAEEKLLISQIEEALKL